VDSNFCSSYLLFTLATQRCVITSLQCQISLYNPFTEHLLRTYYIVYPLLQVHEHTAFVTAITLWSREACNLLEKKPMEKELGY
jgi:hypothetical protein